MEVIIWDSGRLKDSPIGKITLDSEFLRSEKGTMQEKWLPVEFSFFSFSLSPNLFTFFFKALSC